WLHLNSASIDTGRPLQRILWEQLLWGPRARRLGVDLLHSMAFVLPFVSGIRGVVTVYDLSFMYYPEQYPAARRLYLKTQTARSCRAAERVIAIAEDGKRDIHNFFKVPLEQIDVVYPGLSPAYTRPDARVVDAFRAREQLPKRFVLHVGTLQPRKNLITLIEAFHQLNLPDVHLILAGGKGWFFDQIFAIVERLGLENRVHFIGYVQDAHLPLLYAAADLFVFPSYYEGFGMPIVEAMACGTPVIASDASAMPEAIGGAGLMFQADSTEELAESMLTVLDNAEQAAKMRRVVLVQARQFSWKTAAKETEAIYTKILSAPSR
ncbi:MAG: glycosyltransferase family 1 protein, partial [Chloroflexota bacterium]